MTAIRKNDREKEQTTGSTDIVLIKKNSDK